MGIFCRRISWDSWSSVRAPSYVLHILRLITFTFLRGDWGVPQLPWETREDLDMLRAQRAVGAAMNTWAAATATRFIVSTGDHAYPAGLRSAADKPRLDQEDPPDPSAAPGGERTLMTSLCAGFRAVVLRPSHRQAAVVHDARESRLQRRHRFAVRLGSRDHPQR